MDKDRSIEPITFELILPVLTEYISIPRRVVEIIAKSANYPQKEIEEVKIALGEAVLNVIKHAYNKSKNAFGYKTYRVRYLVYPKRLVIVVKHCGKGFDPHFAMAYVRREKAEKTEGTGWGLFLIKALMDEVEIDSTIGAGTEVRMTKYLKKKNE